MNSIASGSYAMNGILKTTTALNFLNFQYNMKSPFLGMCQLMSYEFNSLKNVQLDMCAIFLAIPSLSIS